LRGDINEKLPPEAGQATLTGHFCDITTRVPAARLRGGGFSGPTRKKFKTSRWEGGDRERSRIIQKKRGCLLCPRKSQRKALERVRKWLDLEVSRVLTSPFVRNEKQKKNKKKRKLLREACPIPFWKHLEGGSFISKKRECYSARGLTNPGSRWRRSSSTSTRVSQVYTEKGRGNRAKCNQRTSRVGKNG